MLSFYFCATWSISVQLCGSQAQLAKMENSKRKFFYVFHSSEESGSESCESENVETESEIESLPPELIYPDSDDDMILSGLVPKYIPHQIDMQIGDGVVTRRQAAAATKTAPASRTESPILEPKNKTSKKLKAKNRKPLPETPEPQLQQPPEAAPETSAETEASISPTPGPSRLLDMKKPPRPLSPMPGPSRRQDFEQPEPQEELSESDDNVESTLVSTNLFEQETKVFENEDFVLLMQKTDHQRQKVITKCRFHLLR